MRKSNIMQLLEKHGKNYYNAPSSKNMTRAIVMHLQAKIWQEPLLATVCHCLLKIEMHKIDRLECSYIVSVSVVGL